MYNIFKFFKYLVYGNEQINDNSTHVNNIKQKNQDRFLYEKNKQLLIALEKMKPEVSQSIQDLIFTLEKTN